MLYQHTQALLAELQSRLMTTGLWQSSPIDPACLQSQLPFCHDTLQFEQWLQFVFIPRMQALIDAQLPLPQNIALAPMGEVQWAREPRHIHVTQTLMAIDTLLSGARNG